MLAEWPDDCAGAYICSLCNPQNLDIGQLLGGAAAGVADSPFYRVIHHEPAPRELLMVANSCTPIHTRLWCILEAHEAWLAAIVRIRIGGSPHQLLTGDTAARFKAETDAAEREAADASAEAAALHQRAAGAGDDATTWAQLQQLQTRIDEANQRALEAQAQVLALADDALIDLSRGQCSYEADATMIRAAVAGHEEDITALTARLIRERIRSFVAARAVLAAVQAALGT